MDSSKCDLNVFENGKSLGFFDMTKLEAEAFCRRKTEETGLTHDWHYFAGRVHVLYLDGANNGTTN
jgi:hypothetical protein